jgi:acetyltransferase-like isoleucine patch superfamily enzyme
MNYISYPETVFRNRITVFRGFLLRFYLILHGCKVGRKLRCHGWPYFRVIPAKNIFIGEKVTIGKRITIEVCGKGKIILDDQCKLTQDVLISAYQYVRIGKNSGVAEYSSIRDADHGAVAGKLIWNQALISEPINIGEDVQISRGCSLFRGVNIENGVIIGANCILTRNFKSIPNGIYFGNPPKLIGKRF